MKVQQIKNIEEFIQLWPYACDCFEATAKELSVSVDREELLRVMSAVVAQPKLGWVGYVEDPFGKKLGMGIAHDATLLASSVRTFVVRYFYHTRGRGDASTALLRSFEQWAKRNGVHKLVINANRASGAAIRCFGARNLNFKFVGGNFEKQLQ